MAAKKKQPTLKELAKAEDLTLRDYLLKELLPDATPDHTSAYLELEGENIYEAMTEAGIVMVSYDFSYEEDELVSRIAYIPREGIPADFFPVSSPQ